MLVNILCHLEPQRVGSIRIYGDHQLMETVKDVAPSAARNSSSFTIHGEMDAKSWDLNWSMGQNGEE